MASNIKKCLLALFLGVCVPVAVLYWSEPEPIMKAICYIAILLSVVGHFALAVIWLYDRYWVGKSEK